MHDGGEEHQRQFWLMQSEHVDICAHGATAEAHVVTLGFCGTMVLVGQATWVLVHVLVAAAGRAAARTRVSAHFNSSPFFWACGQSATYSDTIHSQSGLCRSRTRWTTGSGPGRRLRTTRSSCTRRRSWRWTGTTASCGTTGTRWPCRRRSPCTLPATTPCPARLRDDAHSGRGRSVSV